ncbi:MAG TPA: biotin--[acetyl-CoA-carboxylase] ligase [Alphaproteobacteria bacterium]|nr:biotin--[acetyl-CoA-carboxylase] ligase [Alphaproteobacteria bacterium]MDP6269521.1 biotin--[acetyl-CoA-carboxylase] ligase [Alphaproteobacteria bacterium]MDP7427415.1 biotin--[acetyl-CoA-carboxylase] ligase [Alphaproteobacteria bacterium]HJM51440.1 biotin--[acetyl-CoA-carboxylase] ligase [Alphaproteobacteria bacterium]
MSSSLHLDPFFQLFAHDSLGSTNDEVRRLAAAGEEAGVLVWAREQTAGRGRRGRHWVSGRGNLFCSLLLRPDCPPAQANQLSFVAALAVAGALGELLEVPEIDLKWPNDVLISDAKIAGILLESKIAPAGPVDWVIIGTGINVEHHPVDPERPATSLRAEGSGAEVEAVLENYSKHLLGWLRRWREEGFAPVREAWLADCRGQGRRIEMRLGDRTLTGIFETVDPGGALILADDDGQRHSVGSGEMVRTHLPT